MKLRKIRAGAVVRCMAWHVCNNGECAHHNFHMAHKKCIGLNQVKYCECMHHFVSDIPADEINKEISSDPNLAFRIKKDIEKGDKSE